MAVSFTKATIIGNLTRDAELKITPSGTKVLEVNVATNRGKGESQKTTYFRCAIFGKRGESGAQYLLKGVQVAITGDLVLEEWTDKEGKTRVSANITVDDYQILKYANDGAPKTEEVAADVDFDDVPF